MGLMLVQCCLSPLPSPPPLVILLGYPNSYGCYPFKKTWALWELHSLPKNRQQCFNKRLNLNMESGSYHSHSIIRRTVFFKKFLISTKNYRQSLGASYRRIFSWNNFFYHSHWYDFKQIKGHSVGHWLI